VPDVKVLEFSRWDTRLFRDVFDVSRHFVTQDWQEGVQHFPRCLRNQQYPTVPQVLYEPPDWIVRGYLASRVAEAYALDATVKPDPTLFHLRRDMLRTVHFPISENNRLLGG
jgi:hypothetical protein